MSGLLMGIEPGWRPESYERDVNGVVNMEIVKPWSPILQEAGDGTLEIPELPEPPVINGFVPGAGRWKRTKDGGMAIAFNYESVKRKDDGGGGTQTDDINVRWSVSGSFRQRDIRTHPAFAKLKEIYGWDEARAEFPPEIPLGAGANLPIFGFTAASFTPKLSPVYGTRAFDDLAAVITKHYLTFGPPAGLFSLAGRVVTNPWPALGDVGEGRNWRIMTGQADPHGEYYRVRLPMLLSGPGGWNPDIHGRAI